MIQQHTILRIPHTLLLLRLSLLALLPLEIFFSPLHSFVFFHCCDPHLCASMNSPVCLPVQTKRLPHPRRRFKLCCSKLSLVLPAVIQVCCVALLLELPLLKLPMLAFPLLLRILLLLVLQLFRLSYLGNMCCLCRCCCHSRCRCCS